jgi:hypothetical protein
MSKTANIKFVSTADITASSTTAAVHIGHVLAAMMVCWKSFIVRTRECIHRVFCVETIFMTPFLFRGSVESSCLSLTVKKLFKIIDLAGKTGIWGLKVGV